VRLLAAILALVILSTPAAHAEKHVALVIGNAVYKNAVTLQNPRNDATNVSEALKRLGFETIVGLDLDRDGMEEKLIAFARIARDADVALVYYSGHAMQFGGGNYLMPVDATLHDQADLRRLTRVDDIVADLKQAKSLRILVLDACRVNPLAEELSRSMELTRGPPVDRGLARIIAARGMIISYATQAGQTAADGQGRNSPYTMAFLKNIETPEEISTIFRHITADVDTATRSSQLPELSLSVVEDFYLKGRPQPTADAASTFPTMQPMSEAAQAWAATQGTTSQAVLEDFVKRYGDSYYGTLARTRLDELKKSADLAVSECDRLAASPYDTLPGGITGIPFEQVDPVKAIPACRDALAVRPDDPRISYQLGRALDKEQSATGDAEAARFYRKAADDGNTSAMVSLGNLYKLGRASRRMRPKRCAGIAKRPMPVLQSEWTLSERCTRPGQASRRTASRRCAGCAKRRTLAK
jgi:uncharacterized caspase-like protein